MPRTAEAPLPVAMSTLDRPRLDERATFVYLEKGTLEKDADTIAFFQGDTRVPVPVSSLAVVLLGPGATVTQQAVRVVADSGCGLAWVGEQGVRLYAGSVGSGSAELLARQARAWADPDSRFAVAKAMFRRRFDAEPRSTDAEGLLLEEAVRMKGAYETWTAEAGVEWEGRDTSPAWEGQTAANRAISVANAALYGLSHVAVLMLGLCPGLGFVHSGDPRSFVFDVADLYKGDVLPVALRAGGGEEAGLESRVRRAVRDRFVEVQLLARMASDLPALFAEYGPDPGRKR